MFEKLKERFTRYKPRDEKESLDFSPPPPNALKPKEARVKRSKRYHAYFDGYAERKVWDAKRQKEVIERIYIEDYYARNLTKKQRVLNFVLYYALCIGGLALFIWGSQQRIEAQFRYVYLPGMAILLMEVALLWTLANFSAAPIKLTVGEYRSGSRRLITYSLITAVAMAVQALALLVYVIIFPEGGSAAARIFSVVGNALASGCMFCLYHLEHTAEYVRIENENSYLKQSSSVHLIRR